MGITRRDFLKAGIIAAGASIPGYAIPTKSRASTHARYWELPGTATDWPGEAVLNLLEEKKEEVAGILSDYSNLRISDGSYIPHPDKGMITDNIDTWHDAKKSLLFVNVPRLERLGGSRNEKINFGETEGECYAKLYMFEGMPPEARKEIEGEVMQKSLVRGSQAVISQYWMWDAIDSNSKEFFGLFDSVFPISRNKNIAKNHIKTRRAQFIRIPSHYDDTTSMCATIDYIPSLRKGNVYLYYQEPDPAKDRALKLEACHEDIAKFMAFFQRDIDGTMEFAGFPDHMVLKREYYPGHNILGLPIE